MNRSTFFKTIATGVCGLFGINTIAQQSGIEPKNPDYKLDVSGNKTYEGQHYMTKNPVFESITLVSPYDPNIRVNFKFTEDNILNIERDTSSPTKKWRVIGGMKIM